MMRVMFKCLSLVIFLSCFTVTSAWACSCHEYPTPCRAFVRDDAIFVGKVIGFHDTEDTRVYRFQVSEAIKGVAASTTIEIVTAPPADPKVGMVCFTGFEVGGTYLMYAAHEVENSDVLYTGYCYGSKFASGARDDLELLRALRDKKPTNYVLGHVFNTAYDFEEGYFLPEKGLANVRVVIESERHRFAVTTDADGGYRIESLPPARYRITASVAESYDELKPQEILIEATDCPRATNFAATVSGGLSGKVFDRNGHPVSNALVTLRPANPADAAKTLDEDEYPKIPFRDRTDEHGAYSFHKLPPGRYYLIAELDAPPKIPVARLQAFYPQAVSQSGARVVRVSAKNTTENIDIRLTRIAVRRIEVKLLWSDGAPLDSSASVSLRDKREEDDEGFNSSAKFEGEGRFSLQVIEGVDYWLSAHLYAAQSANGDGARALIEATPVRVRVERNKPTPELVVTLQKL